MENNTVSIFTFSNFTTEGVLNGKYLEDAHTKDQLTENLSLIIQSTMAFVGFIGNSLTFITLKKNGRIFASSSALLKLLKNQAVLDAVVCLLGSVYVLQPTMWKTHWNEQLDIFICHVSKSNLLP